MQFHFYKYQGTGNDFVVLDDRNQQFDQNNDRLIAKMCDRRLGIGADGLILLRSHAEYDFEMRYFNANGSEGSMCGNGGRCIVSFANKLGLFDSKTQFMAVDGVHEAMIENELVHLKMQDVAAVETTPNYYFVDTGSEHTVSFVDNLAQFDVVHQGKLIRHSERFSPAGVNVNFIECQPNNTLSMRTFERGVEDETFSCGTGATAAAIVAHKNGMTSPININTLGGLLKVSFDYHQHKYQNIYLVGPAELVFDGYFEADV